MPEDSNAKFQSGQYDVQPQNSSSDQQEPDKEQKIRTNSGAALKYLTIALVAAAVVIVVYYVVFRSNAIQSSSGYAALEQSGSIYALTNTLSYGYNSMPDLNVSYQGTVSLGVSYLDISLPLTLTLQKYGNDSFEDIYIQSNNTGSALGTISNYNISLYYINGTRYVCIAASTTSGCVNVAEFNSTSDALASSLLDNISSMLSKTLQLSITSKTVTGSTFDKNSCTLFAEKASASINATFPIISYFLTSSNESIPEFPVNISSCLSNEYYGIPYNLSFSIPSLTVKHGNSSVGDISISINLNSKYLNTIVSKQKVTTLPYPMENLSKPTVSPTGSSSSAPTSNATCLAYSGFSCRILSYSSGYLTAEIGLNTSGGIFYNAFAFFLNDSSIQAFQDTNQIPKSDFSISIVGDISPGVLYPVTINTDTNFTDIPGELWIAYNPTSYAAGNYSSGSQCTFSDTTNCEFMEVGVVST